MRNLRIPVATVLRLLVGGLSEPEILSEYPDLQTEDIRECLRFGYGAGTASSALGLRFLVDDPLLPRLASPLVAAGHDAVHDPRIRNGRS